MVRTVPRHRTFAWIEFQDERDAVWFHHGLSRMGWVNPLSLLPAASVAPSKLPNGVEITGGHRDNAHPDLEILLATHRMKVSAGGGKAFKKASGLFIRPTTEEHIRFLEKWIFSPGVNRDEGKLTFGKDATEEIDLLVVSGHGGSGTCYTEGGPTDFHFLDAIDFALHRLRAGTAGRPPLYLIVAACNNLVKDVAFIYQPVHEQLMVRIIMGFADKYSGDAIGARVMHRFTELMRKKGKMPILDAWEKANERSGQDWGATLDVVAGEDTMEDLLTLPELMPLMGIIHFADSHGSVSLAPPDEPIAVRFVVHNADGTETEITKSNNTDPKVGLFPGQEGHLRIDPSPHFPLKAGDRLVIQFHYHRHTKPWDGLEKLLEFKDQTARKINGTLTVLENENKEDDAEAKRHGKPVKIKDAIEYIVAAGEEVGLELPYTVDSKLDSTFTVDTDKFYTRVEPPARTPFTSVGLISNKVHHARVRAP